MNPLDHDQAAFAWTIPGNDQATCDGFIPARLTKEGEFTKPLYTSPPETEKLRGALESIAGWRNLNISGEYEHALRDIIRSICDCAAAALEASTNPSQTAESITGVYCGLDAEQSRAVDLKWENSHD